MKIKALSDLTNISVHTLRYYEKLGLLNPIRHENNYRTYTDKDLYALKMITVLQYAQFSLKDIKTLFDSLYLPPSKACNDKVNKIFDDKIIDLERKITSYRLIIKILKQIPLTDSSDEFKAHQDEIIDEINQMVETLYDSIKGDI